VNDRSELNPPSKTHVSVARVLDAWYVLCASAELRAGGVLARRLMGQRLVLFRGRDGRPGALLDRCPHRNVPLSEGRVEGDHLQCPYHGWRFDRGGVCRVVPGLVGEHENPKRDARRFATVERDGYVWVWGREGAEPTDDPYAVPLLDEPGYTTVRHQVEARGSVHATVENALDVPHTAFLHRGLFRGRSEPVEIRAVVTRRARSVQAEYIGEPRPPGLVARLLSPSGGLVTHYDRFILPCVAQVEYRLGPENHIVITSLCTPMDDFHTRLFAVVSFRLRVPHWLVRLALRPLALRIFGQDAVILGMQTEAIEHFGGERFTSTELDLLGGQIWRLLRRAEQGRIEGDEDDPGFRREVRLRV
jgi:phenylpropionate dioxygenase-like ring-hydroxylating dioxygenase large terminal subunit